MCKRSCKIQLKVQGFHPPSHFSCCAKSGLMIDTHELRTSYLREPNGLQSHAPYYMTFSAFVTVNSWLLYGWHQLVVFKLK